MTRSPTPVDPVLVARLALAVAWCARMEGAAVLGERGYLLGPGSERLDEATTARRLASLPKPLRLDALAEPPLLRLHATPLAPGSPELEAFRREQAGAPIVSALTPEEDPAYPGIAVYAAGSVLHVSPAALEALGRDFWIGAPAFFAGDFPGSALVAELELTDEELEGVSEVILLGRSGPEGAVAPIRRPHRPEAGG